MPSTDPSKQHYFKSDSKQERNMPVGTYNKVFNNILECIGNTPLVKLNTIPKEYNLECEIYAKCEFFNPAGSIKDRVVAAMVKDAKAHGVIHSDSKFVEATSGNTGIAVAFNAALIGNQSIIITSIKNSDEKVNTMRLMGAEVIQTKTNQSPTKIAREIKDADPERVVMLNQFNNDINPRTHYEETAVEILSAIGNVDMVVMGAGTGGTMSGIGHKFKDLNPKCVVIAAEPDGSTMFNKHGRSHPFLVEGIGGNTIPITLDTTIADSFEVVTDEEAFLMARELSKKEGLLCGGSSGTAMSAAIKAAKRLKLTAQHRVVVILPDGIRNYMDKFVSDQWMEAHRFLDPPAHTMKWWNTRVSELKTPQYPKVDKRMACSDVLNAMGDKDLALVVDSQGNYLGVASKDGFRNYATNPVRESEPFDFKSPVEEYMVKHVFTMALNSKKGMPTIGLVSRVLDVAPFVVIGNEKDLDHFEPKGVAKSDDIIEYIWTSQNMTFK